MKIKSVLFTAPCAVIVFTSFDASARIWRYHRPHTVYWQPQPKAKTRVDSGDFDKNLREAYVAL